LLVILPFVIMEVVNRRNYNEDFPGFLFFFMWLNLFAISLILLPLVRGRRAGNQDVTSPVPAQGNALLTNPRSATILSVVLFLAPILLFLLDALGWLPLQTVINGPNPEQVYLPGLFISLVLYSLPVASGVIARGPLVSTLRAGGSLLAHPINLIIVVLLLSAYAIGVASLIIDQWPCFIGVPHCD
jgi:hypothetical protein